MALAGLKSGRCTQCSPPTGPRAPVLRGPRSDPVVCTGKSALSSFLLLKPNTRFLGLVYETPLRVDRVVPFQPRKSPNRFPCFLLRHPQVIEAL